MYKIISIEGNLSSGKHLFLLKLKKKYRDDNRYIVIDDIDRNKELNFSNKIKELLDKYELIKRTIELNGNKIYIMNRTLESECNVYTKLLYEQGKMTEEEWESYNRIYNLLEKRYEPDNIIYIDREVGSCLKYEDTHSLIDLQHCDALYKEYLLNKNVNFIDEYFKKKSK